MQKHKISFNCILKLLFEENKNVQNIESSRNKENKYIFIENIILGTRLKKLWHLYKKDK